MCLKTIIMVENDINSHHFPDQTLENSFTLREESNSDNVFFSYILTGILRCCKYNYTKHLKAIFTTEKSIFDSVSIESFTSNGILERVVSFQLRNQK